MATNRNQANAVFHFLRWDRTADKIEFEFKYDRPPMFHGFPLQPPNIKRITVKRDKHYILHGKLFGQGYYSEVHSFMQWLRELLEQIQSGTLRKSQLIKFKSHSYDYSISGHFFTKLWSPEFVVKADKIEDSFLRYKLAFAINFLEAHHRTEYVSDGDKEPVPPLNTTFVEWCANAPTRGIAYSLRSTKVHTCMERMTETSEHVRKSAQTSNSTSFDHFMFQFHDFNIEVQFIENIDNISFSQKLAIKYYSRTGNSPTILQRNVVVEFLSFVFGRHILPVGSSLFEKIASAPDFDQIVSFRGQNPWGDDLVIVSRTMSYPPIEFSPFLAESESESEPPHLDSPAFTIESFIEKFLPRYEEERSKSRLVDLLWGIWTAQPQSDDQRLPIYASALESVAKAYLKANAITLEYISSTEATILRQEVLKCVDEFLGKLDLSESAKRGIKNGLSNINQYSANERMKKFQEAIGLELFDREKAAIRRRNASAHGDRSVLTEVSDEKQQQASMAEYVYRTLLHRVFLRILGYEGRYIDYGTVGFPERLMTDKSDD